MPRQHALVTVDGGNIVRAVSVVGKHDAKSTGDGRPGRRAHAHLGEGATDGDARHTTTAQIPSSPAFDERVITGFPHEKPGRDPRSWTDRELPTLAGRVGRSRRRSRRAG